MADYISREAAIERFCNVYCGCSPEECGFKIQQDGAEECAAVRALKETPAADVRPVVLCRDCKHFEPYPGDYTDGEIEGVCKRHNSIGVLVTDEDFCSDAERI